MPLDNYKVSWDGCWEYQGCLMPNGYSKIGKNGKSYLGHRLAWITARGDIPDGLCVLHKCDNRKCINPDHLFLGTKQDNTDDMMRKGRGRFVGLQSPNCRKPTPPKGERHFNAKLTEKQVEEMRAMYGGGATQVAIAAKFGVRQCHVSRILRKESWAHV